ncbi:MAG: methyltransferase [Bacteroidales bacterium]|jgi:tRNA1Val (adenine37-N6)-methyltransferase|nr:methyltransferase [Bacteroidales bacterium]
MNSSKPFNFRQFTIYDDLSTMKVNTDGVLLGALVPVDNYRNILEIGCGAGYISIMLAQKNLNAQITAIDIDKNSIAQANYNFRNCKWANRLSAYNISLEDFAKSSFNDFDLIISNPPFYLENYRSIKSQNLIAKHSTVLDFSNFLSLSSNLMNDYSKLCIILSAKSCNTIISIARDYCLFTAKQINIIPRENKKISRVVLFLEKHLAYPIEVSNLIIRNEDLSYTNDFLELTKDYLLL